MKLITIFLTLFTIQNTFSIDYLRLTKKKAFIKGSLFLFEEIDKDPYIGDCVVSYKEAVKGDVSKGYYLSIRKGSSVLLKNQFVKLTPNLKPQQVAINAVYTQFDHTVFGSDDYSKSITVYMDSRISRKKVQSLGVLFHSEYSKQGCPFDKQAQL
jgi:hypothetical protein